MVSIIVPLYKCEFAIQELTKRLTKTFNTLNLKYEIIYINDSSPFNDWKIVTNICEINKNVKGIKLSRNFGQHYAITAGLQNCSGEWIVVMDGDLQDQPEEILKLYYEAQNGYDIVLAKRVARKDSFIKRKTSQIFYKTLAYLTDTDQNAEVANFGIYNRKVIKAVLDMKDKIRYFPAMIKWVGFRRTEIIVQHASRNEGKSSYNLKTLMRLALNTILAFSDKPLRLTIKLGLFISFLSFVFAIYTLYRAITGQIEVIGYSSMIISIWFFSGVIITLIGMVGLYIGRIFDQVKDRPIFIIDEKINF